jgi:NAD(P) transhydrogenase
MVAALGIDVCLVDGKDRLLPFLDAEISERLRSGMERIGVRTFLKDKLDRIERGASAVRVTLRSGAVLETERALFAAGRLGCTAGLGLESAGVALDERGLVKVNEHFQTTAPHVYAAGDVIGFPGLASTSMEQARVAMCHAFQFTYKQHVASLLPYGIYTIPEVSCAGETEESCRERGIDHEVGRARYENNARGQITGDTNGLLKLVFARADQKLLGVHCVGESATELVHLGLMVLTAGGGIDTFIQAVFNFPTLSEMYKYAAYDGLGNLSGRKMREG